MPWAELLDPFSRGSSLCGVCRVEFTRCRARCGVKELTHLVKTPSEAFHEALKSQETGPQAWKWLG